MVELSDLTSNLQTFDSEEILFHFTIKERTKEFVGEIKGKKFRMMNGESVFGPVEIWPAQLQDFGHFIAERTKAGDIKLDKNTFSKENIIQLLKTYKPSLFERSYTSTKEVSETFTTITKYLDAGIRLGVIEKSIEEEFNKLPVWRKMIYKTIPSLGKKYLDSVCEEEPIKQAIDFLETNLHSYERLHVMKYEAIGKKANPHIL